MIFLSLNYFYNEMDIFFPKIKLLLFCRLISMFNIIIQSKLYNIDTRFYIGTLNKLIKLSP